MTFQTILIIACQSVRLIGCIDAPFFLKLFKYGF